VGQTATTNEDTAILLTLAASDSNSSTLTFSIVTTPTKGTLSALSAPICTPSGSGTNCTVKTTYTPNANVNGSDSFTFRASDGTNLSAPATVNLTITAINDPPTFNVITNKIVTVNAPVQNVSITGVAPGPASATDEAAQSVTLMATSSNPSIVPNPTMTGTGSSRTLTYQPIANATGTVTITVRANDGQAANNTFTRTFTVLVTDLVAKLKVKIQNLTGVSTTLKTSLVTKLTDVETKLNEDKISDACLKLADFITAVTKEKGKGLTVAQTNDLLADANQIKATLGCP
jgi:Big-like domain-containing protein